MDLLHLIALALLQGLTEFLPISSSAHLILLPYLAGWPDQGLVFDVAVHLGSLAAVVTYFRHDLRSMAVAWLGSVVGQGQTADSRLAWAVLAGTIPVGIVGYFAHDFVASDLRSPIVIAWATIGFGVLLLIADVWGPRQRGTERLRGRDVVFIGIAQACALIPGTSRSGVTITAGLALGLTRTAAARFSFLLAIPVIAFASGLEIVRLAQHGGAVDGLHLATATVVAAGSAYLCIVAFLRLIERIGMWPFVLYRCVFGVTLLWILA